MSVDTCNDYYQLCYNSDSSQSRDDEYDRIIDEEFPYQQYFSSPKVYHTPKPLVQQRCSNNSTTYSNGTNTHYGPYKEDTCALSPGSAIYSDLDTMKTRLQSSYLSDKLRKTSNTNMENVEDKKFIEEAVSCLESLLGNENTAFDNSLKASTEQLTNGLERESSDVTISSEKPGGINVNASLPEVNNLTDFHFESDDISFDSKYFHDEDLSSSGVSSYNHSPSSSCLFTNASSQNLLNIEIDRLKNIASNHHHHSSNTYNKRHSLPKEMNNSYTDITLCDEKLNLVNYDTNTRSVTPNGRKSPFLDLFKSKRYFDFDTQSYCRQKINKRLNKANFFCHFKKSSMKSVNLMEKHNSENRIESDVNDEMKIHHASPFVRTIFQYVESSSVEDIFSSSSFNINDSNSVPVFTCGGMRTLQENNKFNSLSRKCKKNQIIRTMERGQHEPALVTSGRRISENSDFYISVIAYLDRIRRAKGTSLRRRPRHRRHKSDPGDSISTFLSEMSQMKYKQCTSSSDQLDDIRMKSPVDENDSKCSLSQRFADLHCSDPKTFKSQFSTSDSAINHRFSLCEDITDNEKKVFSRKSRSLRNISSYASKKKCSNMNESKRNSTDSIRLNESLLSSEDVFQEEKENIEKMPFIKKELFPENSGGGNKNFSPNKKSVLTESNGNLRIHPPRRSVFSENFEMPWPPLLTKTTPDELKTWLDSQESNPEDRQKLTEQLLLQLIQMGPAAAHVAEAKSASKNNLVNSTTSINENSYFHDVSDQSWSSISEKSEQNEQADNKGKHVSNASDSITPESQNGTSGEKMNRTKKLFGSIRRNRRSKSLDWNRTQYSNDAYDSDSLKRKSKTIAAKSQHSNSAQKMKRFSMIRSIFEPIKSPKAKKSIKSPINVKKLDTDTKVHCHYNGIVNKQNGTSIMNGITSKSKPDDVDEPKIIVNMKERPPRFDHAYVKESLSKSCFPEGELNLTSISASSFEHVDQQNACQKSLTDVNEKRSSFTDNNERKSFKRSRSIDSIPDEIKVKELNRKVVSRSADAIYEMKQHTSVAAALYQDIHDSGILHGSNGGPDGKSKSPDVIEVFISNSLVKKNDDFEGVHIADEVTSSEPSLNWNKVDCLNGSCNNCCVSLQHSSVFLNMMDQEVANKEKDGSRIIVDVPHHLIPPEIASKSPINSPNVRRKGLLKKTPCLLQHPLIQGEKGEKGNDFTSADSGLSLSDETDYTQQQDVTNFCLIRETKTISNGNKNTFPLKKTASVDKNTSLSPTSEVPIVIKNTTTKKHSRQNSFHKTEILHRVDSPKTDGHRSIPHVITISKNHPADSNGHAPNEHRLKIISPILPKNKEQFFVKSSSYENESESSIDNNINRTNTIKCQRNSPHSTSYSISNQKEEQKNEEKKAEAVAPTNTVTVARVSPFNKNEDTPEDEDSLEDVRIPPSKQNVEETEENEVSEIGKTFENTTSTSNSSDSNKTSSSTQNGSSVKIDIRTPQTERKFDMVTRVSNDKSSGNLLQLKHGLYMKQNSNDSNDAPLDINANIVYENEPKLRISKSNHNYENINYETVHGRSIVTNGDPTKHGSHIKDVDTDSKLSSSKSFGKGSNNKFTENNKDTNKNGLEVKDQYGPPSRAENSFEVNRFECDTRSSSKTANSKGNGRIDYNIVIENQPNRPNETYNNTSSDNEKVINSPPTPRRTRKTKIESNEQLSEKNNPLCTTNNKDNDKTYICQQNLKNQNCEFIKNNLKDEKPKKINNIDTSIKTNYGNNYNNCDVSQVTSPKGLRKDYDNNSNLNNSSTDRNFSVKPSNVSQISTNHRTLNNCNGEIKTHNKNTPNDSSYTTERYKNENLIHEKKNGHHTTLNNSNELSKTSRGVRNCEKNPDDKQTNSNNGEVYTRTQSHTHVRSVDENTDTPETYARVRSRSRNNSTGNNPEKSDTYSNIRSPQRDRSIDNNPETSSSSEVYTRARPRSRTSSIGSENNSNTLTRTRSRTRNRSKDNNPDNNPDVYTRARSRTRDQSIDSNSENSEIYTRPPRTRSRTSSIGSNSENSDTLTRTNSSRQRERSANNNSEISETYTRVRTRSRNSSVGSNPDSNSDTLTRNRSRQRDRIANDNTNNSEIYSRPQSRSRGRSIDKNENAETYTRPRPRSRASSVESNSSEVEQPSYTRTRSRTRDRSSDNSSETAKTYSRTRSIFRGNSFEKNQDNDSYNSLTRSRSRTHDRTINSNFENSEAYKRIKELARQRIASRSRNNNINHENSDKSEIVPRPWNRSFDDDVNNSNNSSESESYTRSSNRNLPNRNSISDSTISDSTMSDCTISDSERSVDDKDDEQVYRRRSRRNSLDEDGPRMRRYRSNDSGASSPAPLRRRDGKRESSRSSNPARNEHYQKNDPMLHNRNSSSIESLTSLQSNGSLDIDNNSNHSNQYNNVDYSNNDKMDIDDTNNISKRKTSIQKSSSDTNLDDCECGTTGTGSKLRRNNSKSGQNSHRSSLTDLTSSAKQNGGKNNSNEEPTSPITRNKSKSDPSLHCSPYYYDWSNGNDEGSSQTETQNQNGDSTVVTRRRNATTSKDDSKRRHHSTGHSPDITVLLQHLICDIEEEEVMSSSEDQDDAKKVDEDYKLQQLEAFNRNLNELITASADELNTFGIDLPNKPMRRTLSEDDIGLKLLRMQRLKRKNNCGEMQLTRKPSVIWAVVKKMEVSLVIQKDYGEPEIIKIEDFNVRRVNTYKDVEELAIDTYMKHLQLLDKQHLDLDTYDIKYLQMSEHKVPIGSPFDLSIVKIEDNFLPCRLCMKAKESWSLASLSYESLIPKSYLEKYVSLILSHHHAIFFGPSGTGKSYLAERIANLINHRMNEGKIPPIILKNVTPERWNTLLTNLAAEKREKAYVVILDGFSQRFIDSDIDIYDIVKVCDEHEPKPYIICTMTITPTTKIPAKWQLSFRWIWLSNHEEPIDGVLQRYLRRKFIQYGNQHLQRESFRIADWLTSVWRHINTFLNKFTSTDCSLGPTMFYECPSDILDAEEWFVDLWNYSITPYILHSVKQGLKQHGVRCEWEDPLGYILKSYPWVSEKVKKKMKLKRICMEDVDFSLHCHTEEEKQRLLDFLRQLEVMMFEDIEPGNNPRLKSYRKESSL